MKKIILASASPRRKALLETLGLKFDIEPAMLNEDAFDFHEARRLVRELSRKKAKVVARKHGSAVIIAADTVVALGDRIFGKPHTRTEARMMLRSLSGKPHVVITAFTLADTDTKKTLTKIVETTVYMKSLSQAEINAYVKTGEPLDKAGGYAIQGLGSIIVERIDGDYYNVVGLPLNALAESLKEFQINVLNNYPPAAKRAAHSPAKKPVENAACRLYPPVSASISMTSPQK